MQRVCHLRKKHRRSKARLSKETPITTTTTIDIRARPTEVAQSLSDETNSVGIVRNLMTILMIVGSCRTRKKEMVLTNRKNKSDGNGKAVVVSSDNSDGDCLVVFVGCVSCNYERILDSACSFHISCNKDRLSSYELMQSGDVVLMGYNNSREIMGIGSVRIRMHDGMIRTSTKVIHGPGMARNLISLNNLDVKCYNHCSSQRVFKVSKGSLIN
jgi:hypothetical protein